MTKQPIKKKCSPLAVPKVPEVLRIIGEESRRNGTDTLTSRQIDAAIKTYRAQKGKR